MTITVIHSDRFDLTVTQHADFKGDTVYLLRYGLETKRHDDLADAMHDFMLCLDHAMAGEGIDTSDWTI